MSSCIRAIIPNRKKPKTMNRITVTVDPDNYVAFDRLAAQVDVTASWLIRRSMRELLHRHEREGSLAILPAPTGRRASGGA